METKDRLLILLEKNIGKFLSGEAIAGELSVSRTAVWKAVKNLRNSGYDIQAVRNRGYRLSLETDVVTERGIYSYLQPVCSNIELDIVDTLCSTNEKAREKAIKGTSEGYTVIALNQTNGKGRRGRSFYSPSRTGLYMSILLRPRHNIAQQASRLTAIAAIAVCEAIEAVSDKTAQIKWVNDIYVEGKKVCGILTEAAIALENGYLEYVVLGVGINVYCPNEGFPNDLEKVAGAIFSKQQADGRNKLAAEFLNHFMAYYSEQNEQSLLKKYRRRNFVLGKTVQVISAEDKKSATALDIDDNYHLLVEYENGEREYLLSGEISVKIEDGITN